MRASEINAIGGYYAYSRRADTTATAFLTSTVPSSPSTRSTSVWRALRFTISCATNITSRSNSVISATFWPISPSATGCGIWSAWSVPLPKSRRRFSGAQARDAHAQEYHCRRRSPWRRRTPFMRRRSPYRSRRTEGRICSEFVMCYPPGIPILAPGERDDAGDHLDYIHYAKEKGCSMTGTGRPRRFNRLNVLKEESDYGALVFRTAHAERQAFDPGGPPDL